MKRNKLFLLAVVGLLTITMLVLTVGGVLAGSPNVLSNADFTTCTNNNAEPARWQNLGAASGKWTCGAGFLKTDSLNAGKTADLYQCAQIFVQPDVNQWSAVVTETVSTVTTFDVFFLTTTDCSFTGGDISTAPQTIASGSGLPTTFIFTTGELTKTVGSVALHIKCANGESCGILGASVESYETTPATAVKITSLEARPVAGFSAWLQKVLRWMINPLGW